MSGQFHRVYSRGQSLLPPDQMGKKGQMQSRQIQGIIPIFTITEGLPRNKKNLHTRINSIINIVFLALEMHLHQYPQKDCPQKFLQHIKRQRLRYRHLLYLQRRSQKIKTCCLIRQIGMHQQLKI